MIDKELCMNCKHPVTFDGYNYTHNRQEPRISNVDGSLYYKSIDSYCCTGTNTIAVTNKYTKKVEIMEVGCICINPKGKKDDLERRGVTQYGNNPVF